MPFGVGVSGETFTLRLYACEFFDSLIGKKYPEFSSPLFALYHCIKMGDSDIPADSWQAKASARRAQRDSALPAEWKLPSAIWDSLKLPLESNKNNLIELDIVRKSGILTQKELEITENFDVDALLNLLATGKLSALEVTIAFSKRAAIAQELVSDSI